MLLYEAVCTVLMDLLIGTHDNNIVQHITINLIVMVRPCLATGTLSEEKPESYLAS